MMKECKLLFYLLMIMFGFSSFAIIELSDNCNFAYCTDDYIENGVGVGKSSEKQTSDSGVGINYEDGAYYNGDGAISPLTNEEFKKVFGEGETP